MSLKTIQITWQNQPLTLILSPESPYHWFDAEAGIILKTPFKTLYLLNNALIKESMFKQASHLYNGLSSERIWIDGRRVLTRSCIWFWSHGMNVPKEPELWKAVRPINGDRGDSRLSNLTDKPRPKVKKDRNPRALNPKLPIVTITPETKTLKIQWDNQPLTLTRSPDSAGLWFNAENGLIFMTQYARTRASDESVESGTYQTNLVRTGSTLSIRKTLWFIYREKRRQVHICIWFWSQGLGYPIRKPGDHTRNNGDIVRHSNGILTDNRIENLTTLKFHQFMGMTNSGRRLTVEYPRATTHKSRGKYRACVICDLDNYKLFGYWPTIEEAQRVANDAVGYYKKNNTLDGFASTKEARPKKVYIIKCGKKYNVSARFGKKKDSKLKSFGVFSDQEKAKVVAEALKKFIKENGSADGFQSPIEPNIKGKSLKYISYNKDTKDFTLTMTCPTSGEKIKIGTFKTKQEAFDAQRSAAWYRKSRGTLRGFSLPSRKTTNEGIRSIGISEKNGKYEVMVRTKIGDGSLKKIYLGMFETLDAASGAAVHAERYAKEHGSLDGFSRGEAS